MKKISVSGKFTKEVYIDPLEALERIQSKILQGKDYIYQNDKGEYILVDEYQPRRKIEEKTTSEMYHLYQSLKLIKSKVRELQEEEKKEWARNILQDEL